MSNPTEALYTPTSPWQLLATAWPHVKITPEMASLLAIETDMSKTFWLKAQEIFDRGPVPESEI